MNLIDPFQFRDLFQAPRSLAVIGNAPTILEWQNGTKIDSADLVVRFNRARTGGLEQQIGSRTDVLVVNASNSLKKAPPPDDLCHPKCLVCFIAPSGCQSFDAEPFKKWAGDVPVLFTFGPDLIGLRTAARQRPLTSGTYAIYTLLRLFDVERLFLTGFTMFGAVDGGVGKYWDEPVPHAAYAHDLDHEAQIFVDLLAQYKGVLELTPEIEALTARYGLRGRSRASRARYSLSRRIAAGLSWRFLHMGMSLRRVAESK